MQQANLADSSSIPRCADYPSDTMIPLTWNITNSLRTSLSQPQASEGKKHHRTPRTCRDSSFSAATSTRTVFLFSEVPRPAHAVFLFSEVPPPAHAVFLFSEVPPPAHAQSSCSLKCPVRLLTDRHQNSFLDGKAAGV